MFNLTFRLDQSRVARLERSGVHSIRELWQVLEAMDLRATIELDPWRVEPKPEPPAEKSAEEPAP